MVADNDQIGAGLPGKVGDGHMGLFPHSHGTGCLQAFLAQI